MASDATREGSELGDGTAPPRAPGPGPTTFTPAASSFLDLVRVIATNLVLLAHAAQLFDLQPRYETGALGVVLFFLLSGFLITLAGLKRWDRPGEQFSGFMIDRCARIFVPYLPALVCVALLNLALPLEHYGQMGVNEGSWAFFANALLLNDYPLFQAASGFVDVQAVYPRSYNAAEPFWTIPIEFWTYVVFGLVFFGLLRRESLRPALALPLLAVATPVFVWNAFAGGSGVLSVVWILGAMVGYLWWTSLAGAPRLSAVGGLAVGFGALCLAGRSAKVGYDAYEFQQGFFVACILFGLFFLLARVRRNPGVGGAMATALADYSYSLYLTHNTVLILCKERLSAWMGELTPWFAMLAAHVVAYLFYRAFERHYRLVGRRLKQQFGIAG